MSDSLTRGLAAVHKFEIPIGHPVNIPVCRSASVVHVGIQRGAVTLWMLVQIDGDENPLPAGDGRWFEVYGTGHPIPGNRFHCGTILDGIFEWHIFEAPQRKAPA